MSVLNLPPGLTSLIAEGVWPSKAGPSMMAQQSNPIIPVEWVRRFAAEESVIWLAPPPFQTLADEVSWGDGFWGRYCALHQIGDPERALIIGDFGIGSDVTIILDFNRDASNPPVLRLRWRGGLGNEWVQGARDFDEFAAMLGLGQGPAEPVAAPDPAT